jgi:hypothetical protein
MRVGRSMSGESIREGDDWMKVVVFVIGSGMILLLGLDIPVISTGDG